MKLSLPAWLFVLIFFTHAHAIAQCPSGSVNNTAGTYGAGANVCITSNFNGAITLNSGAVMTVISGGNYTGNLVVNAGATLNVQPGGRVAPGSFGNFAGALNNEGTVVMPTVTIAAGANIYNNSVITWPSGWNQNAQIELTNTACGTMSFSAGMVLGNNASVINNGRMNFLGQLTMHGGTAITNRGELYVTGSLTTAGLIYNYNKAVFKGGGNNLNSGDSLINLGWMVFGGSVTNGRPIRNEGLLQNSGAWTINSNGQIRINNANAHFRVGGSLTVNAPLQGNGSLYVNGGLNNNSTISGFNATQRLRVNKALNPASAPNTTLNAAMVPLDTNGYTAAMAQPALCNALLPKAIGILQAVFEQGTTRLQWRAYAETANYFIEFSTDGVHYAVIGEVAGSAGNYQFMHNTNATGNLYYRIREVAVSGMKVYSNIVTVQTATSNVTPHVFPNPFTNDLQVNIFLDESDVIEVALFNAGGQKLVYQLRQGQAGNNAITVSNLSSLMPGLYFARVKTGSKTVYTKLIK